MFVIDDSNADRHINPGDPRCGCFPRKTVYGSLPFAPPSSRATIPMERWPDLIADMDRAKSTAKHRWADSPIGVLDQGQVGYCHAFSAVAGVMVQRAIEGEPYVELSPSSVGGPITGYQNQGAVITDDLDQIVNVGVASTAFVPSLTTNRGDFKAGWEADAAHNKAVLYCELEPRNFLQHGTELLCGKPVCVALNYWGHAVLDVRLVDLNPGLSATNPERYGVEFLNSWKASWGDGGFGVRAGSKKFADMAYVLTQIKPTAV